MKKYGLLLCLLLPVAGAAQTDSVRSSRVRGVSRRGVDPAEHVHGACARNGGQVQGSHRPSLLTTTVGKYSYRIERKGTRANIRLQMEPNGDHAHRWAMGASSAIGQTYILEKDGELYESRVSWFRELNGLGPTMGYVGITPADITDAAGRLMSQR